MKNRKKSPSTLSKHKDASIKIGTMPHTDWIPCHVTGPYPRILGANDLQIPCHTLAFQEGGLCLQDVNKTNYCPKSNLLLD